MAELKVVWPKNIFPTCPYCEQELKEVCAMRDGVSDIHTVYFCPYCHKVLGVGSKSYT